MMRRVSNFFNATAHLNEGLVHHNNGHYDEAIICFNRALFLNRDFAEAYNARGLTYYKQHQYNKALRDYDRAIQLKADFAEAYHNRGLVHHKFGRYDEALQDYGRAIQLKADFAEAYHNRGLVCYTLGRYDEALQDYDQALRLKPDDPEIIWLREQASELLRNQRSIPTTLRSSQHTLKADFAEAHYEQGLEYYTLGCYDEALRDCDRAIQLKADFAEAYYGRGGVYYALGRYDEALQDCDRVIQLKADFAEAHCDRGLICYTLGRYDEALRDCDRAIQLKADFAEAHYNRGLVCYALGRYDEALQNYDQALCLKPDDPEIIRLREQASELLQNQQSIPTTQHTLLNASESTASNRSARSVKTSSASASKKKWTAASRNIEFQVEDKSQANLLTEWESSWLSNSFLQSASFSEQTSNTTVSSPEQHSVHSGVPIAQPVVPMLLEEKPEVGTTISSGNTELNMAISLLQIKIAQLEGAVVLDAEGHVMLRSCLDQYREMTVEEAEKAYIETLQPAGDYYRNLQKYLLCCFTAAQTISSQYAQIQLGRGAQLSNTIHNILSNLFPGISVVTGIFNAIFKELSERKRRIFLDKLLDIAGRNSEAEALIEMTTRCIVRAKIHARQESTLNANHAEEDAKKLLEAITTYSGIYTSDGTRQNPLQRYLVSIICGNDACLDPLPVPGYLLGTVTQASAITINTTDFPVIEALPVDEAIELRRRVEATDQRHSIIEEKVEEGRQAWLRIEERVEENVRMAQQTHHKHSSMEERIIQVSEDLEVAKKNMQRLQENKARVHTVGSGHLQQLYMSAQTENNIHDTELEEAMARISRLEAQLTLITTEFAAMREGTELMMERIDLMWEGYERSKPKQSMDYGRFSPELALKTAISRAVYDFTQTRRPDPAVLHMANELKNAMVESKSFSAAILILQEKLPLLNNLAYFTFAQLCLEELQCIPCVASAMTEYVEPAFSTAANNHPRFFGGRKEADKVQRVHSDLQRFIQILPTLNHRRSESESRSSNTESTRQQANALNRDKQILFQS